MVKKILIVSPDFPFPPTHGGKVDIMRQIEILDKLNVEVDLLVCSKINPSEEEHKFVSQLVSQIIYVERTASIVDIISFKPYQVQSRKKLKDVILIKVYDWIFIEGDYVMSILENKTLKFKNSLFRINNIEFKYFHQLFLSTVTKFKALYYFLESIKFYFFSRKYYKKLNCFAFVSMDELLWFTSKYTDKKNAFQLLQHYDIKKFKSYHYNPNGTVLFVGSLFMPNNMDGLMWYLEKVHPLLLHIDTYKFTIVGSTSKNEALREKLRVQIEKFERVSLHMDVAELDSYYDTASVFINPMFKGAGIKVKTLQAMQFGLPVVSTNVGAEGIGLRHNINIYITDSANLFAEYIVVCLRNEVAASNLVYEAQKLLRDNDGEKMIISLLNH